MCGIGGIISFKYKPLDLIGSIQKMSSAMANRGPDDEGFIILDEERLTAYSGSATTKNVILPLLSDHNVKHANLGLCHRRLSIIDLSERGHQPMGSENENYWIVFNGEIYNFIEIRQILVKKGYTFTTNTDTEVLLKCYIEYGYKCLDYFNGMFAFAIFDKKNKNLFIARDRLGIKPLYFFKSKDMFAFASDIKTLLSSGQIDAKPDMEGLYHNLTLGITPRPMTCFKEITAFIPGYYYKINIETGEMTSDQYWDIPTGVQDNSITEMDAIELIDKAINKSVAYRLISDVSVGTFMSGGVDSTLVSSVASKLSPNIKAYTLGYDEKYGKHFNEVELAKINAAFNNINHKIKIVSPDEILGKIDLIVDLHEEPYYAISPNIIISEFVKNDNTIVVLNGLGGDELFAGYEGYLKFATLYSKIKRFSFLHNFIPYGVNNTFDSLKDVLASKKTTDLYSTLLGVFNERMKCGMFSQKYNSTGDHLYQTTGYGNHNFSNIIDDFFFLNLKSYIGDHHLYRMDKFTMHYSIEGRFPLLDHNLVELSAKIPNRLKIKNGTYKYILKEVAKRYIHHDCIYAKKKGFSFPLAYWMENDLRNIVRKSLSDLRCRSIFNDDAFKANLSHEQKWHLVMVELWMKKFID